MRHAWAVFTGTGIQGVFFSASQGSRASVILKKNTHDLTMASEPHRQDGLASEPHRQVAADGAFDNRGGVVRQSRCFGQEQPPGVVVVSTLVAGINPRGCRGCHLDCQAILARSTPSDTTPLGSSRYWCVTLRYVRLTCHSTSDCRA